MVVLTAIEVFRKAAGGLLAYHYETLSRPLPPTVTTTITILPVVTLISICLSLTTLGRFSVMSGLHTVVG